MLAEAMIFGGLVTLGGLVALGVALCTLYAGDADDNNYASEVINFHGEGVCLSTSRRRDPKNIRVLSWNLEGATLEEHREIVLGIIGARVADILLLQCVDPDLGMTIVDEGGHPYVSMGESADGLNMVISHYRGVGRIDPIEEMLMIHLSLCDETGSSMWVSTGKVCDASELQKHTSCFTPEVVGVGVPEDADLDPTAVRIPGYTTQGPSATDRSLVYCSTHSTYQLKGYGTLGSILSSGLHAPAGIALQRRKSTMKPSTNTSTDTQNK